MDLPLQSIPIPDMPAELLVQIFKLTSRAEAGQVPPLYTSILATNRRWRDVALEEKSLWQDIYVEAPEQKHIQMVKHALRRSGDRELSWTIIRSESDDWKMHIIDDILQILFHHIKRWKHIRLVLGYMWEGDHFPPMLPLITGEERWPDQCALTSIEVHVSSLRAEERFQAFWEQALAVESLRQYSFQRMGSTDIVYPNREPAYQLPILINRNLTHVTITIIVDNSALEHLSSLPNLKYLQIRALSATDCAYKPHNIHIVFNKLQIFRLAGTPEIKRAIFRCCIMPHLQRLEMIDGYAPLLPPTGITASWLRVGMNLEHVTMALVKVHGDQERYEAILDKFMATLHSAVFVIGALQLEDGQVSASNLRKLKCIAGITFRWGMKLQNLRVLDRYTMVNLQELTVDATFSPSEVLRGLQLWDCKITKLTYARNLNAEECHMVIGSMELERLRELHVVCYAGDFLMKELYWGWGGVLPMRELQLVILYTRNWTWCQESIVVRERKRLQSNFSLIIKRRSDEIMDEDLDLW
ncbi:hypothetical protein VNI00_009572 [Paramarasmius palmivorus]|uniref:F-box domain-containing protein n=1 Tax=Paramarasmius palmivorus TaxID=297713 RepID=A0AAW0CPN5_9AGAR